MTISFDWKLGLLALGFMVAGGVAAGYPGLPDGVHAAGASLVVLIAAAVPSWFVHRGDPPKLPVISYEEDKKQ